MIKRLKAELLQARKDKNATRKTVLGPLVSEAVMIGKNMGNRETTDAEALTIIAKFRKGAIEIKGLVGPNCTAYDEAQAEIEIYNEFLPTELTQEEIVKEIGMFLQLNSEKANIGSVMGHFRKNFDKRYNGKTLSKTINEILKD